MSWVKVLTESELPTGARQVVTVEGRSVLLINHNGQIYAVDNKCPHMKLSMKKGKITENNSLVCPWHRSAFDLATGEPTTWTPWPPGVGKVMAMMGTQKALPVFQTRTEDGGIWIALEGASA